MTRNLLISLAFLASGCGPGVSLSALRCGTPCQDEVDPRLLSLLVDVAQPAGLAATTTFHVTLDARALVDLEVVAPEHAGKPSATLPLFVQLAPGELAGHPVADGEEFTIAARAETPDGLSNEVSVRLRLRR